MQLGMNMKWCAAMVVSLASTACAGAKQAPAQDVRTLDLIAKNSAWTVQEVAEVAHALKADGYSRISMSMGSVAVEHAKALMAIGDRYGEMAGQGQELEPGMYWNFAEESAFVVVGAEKGEPARVEILPGRLLVVGNVISDIPGGGDIRQSSSGGSITCGAGYYACCQEAGSTKTAECVLNGMSPTNGGTCTYGGPGATACSIGID